MIKESKITTRTERFKNLHTHYDGPTEVDRSIIALHLALQNVKRCDANTDEEYVELLLNRLEVEKKFVERIITKRWEDSTTL